MFTIQQPLSLWDWDKALISNYIHIWHVITHPCPNFSGSLAQLTLKLEHEWVIISHRKQWMWLLIHVIIFVGNRGPDIPRRLFAWLLCLYFSPGSISQRACELIIQILKTYILFYLNNNDPMRSQFCTCHDSWAVVTCAMLWSDWIINIIIRARRIVAKFHFWALKSFVKWILTHLYVMLFYASGQ